MICKKKWRGPEDDQTFDASTRKLGVRTGIRAQSKTSRPSRPSHPVRFAQWTFPSMLPCLRCIELPLPPSLLNQEGQVVDPIVLRNPSGIDYVAQVVLGIRNNKIGVGN